MSMLDSISIAKGLVQLGFTLAKDNVRAQKFTRHDLTHPVYVKTASQRGKPMYKMPLVLHPALQGSVLPLVRDKVNFNSNWNNSNLVEFPKAVNKNGKFQHYGLALDVVDHEMLRWIISSLQANSLPVGSEANASHETEIEALYQARRGQGTFREKLLKYWQHTCSVSAISLSGILKASHIKPWSESNDTERLDLYNGLLLNPTLDALFDKGLITFSNDGEVLHGKAVESQLGALGITETMRLKRIEEKHLKYLSWHRANVFVG